MRRRKILPSQLASDLAVSHATVSRWLSGKDIPNTQSCQKLAQYSGVPLEDILSIAGHVPRVDVVGLRSGLSFVSMPAARNIPMS